MWITARLPVRPSATWLTISWGVCLLLQLCLYFYPPLPAHFAFALTWQLVLHTLVLLFAAYQWHSWRLLQGELALGEHGRVSLRVTQTGGACVAAKLTGRPAVGSWCCRLALVPTAELPLPRAWRQVVLFSDSFEPEDYRALCRWLTAHSR